MPYQRCGGGERSGDTGWGFRNRRYKRDFPPKFAFKADSHRTLVIDLRSFMSKKLCTPSLRLNPCDKLGSRTQNEFFIGQTMV